MELNALISIRHSDGGGYCLPTLFWCSVKLLVTRSFIFPMPTVMAWCTAAAFGGSLCNLGVPSVAVSWSCHLVGPTQSPHQHLPTIGLSTSSCKYFDMPENSMSVRTVLRKHIQVGTNPGIDLFQIFYAGKRASILFSKKWRHTPLTI